MTARPRPIGYDAERVADWFLFRMGPEQRRELMADMPLVYARMTGASPSVVAAAVRDELDAQDKEAYPNGR